MSILPPEFHTRDGETRDEAAREADARLTARWSALAGAAQVVAGLAQAQQVDAALRIPFALGRTVGGRRQMIEDSIEDMLAMMEPGITALLDVAQRGGQTEPPAMALWQEFLRARRGLAALAPLGTVTN